MEKRDSVLFSLLRFPLCAMVVFVYWFLRKFLPKTRTILCGR